METNKKNERIISIQNEGQVFLIYFDGLKHYDEDELGRKVLSEESEPIYLDESFNVFMLEINKDRANDMLAHMLDKGVPAFIGPHAPEKPEAMKSYDEYTAKAVYKEKMVLNNDQNTVGIWRMPTIEEKEKFTKILLKQNEERLSYKLSYKLAG